MNTDSIPLDSSFAHELERGIKTACDNVLPVDLQRLCAHYVHDPYFALLNQHSISNIVLSKTTSKIDFRTVSCDTYVNCGMTGVGISCYRNIDSRGDVGPTGSAGIRGPVGVRGAIGATGPVGVRGETGHMVGCIKNEGENTTHAWLLRLQQQRQALINQNQAPAHFLAFHITDHQNAFGHLHSLIEDSLVLLSQRNAHAQKISFPIAFCERSHCSQHNIRLIYVANLLHDPQLRRTPLAQFINVLVPSAVYIQ